MIDNKKVIVCIPSGRRGRLSMLLDCLEKESCIDEIHLWENTNDEQDLEFISKYESSTYKAKVIRIEERVGRDICGRVSSFYSHYAEGFDDDTVFLKIDDDVVWIERSDTPHPNSSIARRTQARTSGKAVAGASAGEAAPAPVGEFVWRSDKFLRVRPWTAWRLENYSKAPR